jgi:hypothetical protein
MKVYILGPMSGVPYFNFPAFDAAKDNLLSAGHEPINPADINREFGFDAMDCPPDTDWHVLPQGMDVLEVIQRDVKAILFDAEGYAALPGWERSTGARAERALCEWLGLEEIKLC